MDIAGLSVASLITAVMPGCVSDSPLTIQEDVNITFIEINDLHANLVGHKDLVRYDNGSTGVAIRGGIARMKTIIDQVRSTNPNTIVMNIGDTFHGGVESFYTVGNAVADPLNALGIDIGVPGNWDYYYSPAVTRGRYGRIVGLEGDVTEVTLDGFANPVPLKRPNYPNLGANVRDISDFFLGDFLPATHMFEFSGVKVGFIGFTSDIVELMHPLLAEGMDFAHGLEEHKQLLIEYAQQLRNRGADSVVVMSELGIHKDIALSKALAEMVSNNQLKNGLIDIFFSAHTHEVTKQPITSSKNGTALYAPVVESGNDGYLGRLDMNFHYIDSTTTGILLNQTTEQNWSVTTMNWQLITVDESVAEDVSVKQLVDAERSLFLDPNISISAIPYYMQTLTAPIDTVIGRVGGVIHQKNVLSSVISRKHSLGSTFNQAWTDMLTEVTHKSADIQNARVAISPAFRMGVALPEAGYLMENASIASGEITLEDAYRFFPMYYGLMTAQSTGRHLKLAIEDSLIHTYSADAFNTAGGWTTEFSGVDIKIKLTNGDLLDSEADSTVPGTDGQLPLSRITEIVYSDTKQPVRDGDIINVVGCRRLPIDFIGSVCGIPGFQNARIVTNPNTNLPWSMVDVFVNYLSEVDNQGSFINTLGSTGTGIVDLDNIPMFPDSEFIQPLEGVGTKINAHDPLDTCGFFKWNCYQ